MNHKEEKGSKAKAQARLKRPHGKTSDADYIAIADLIDLKQEYFQEQEHSGFKAGSIEIKE